MMTKTKHPAALSLPAEPSNWGKANARGRTFADALIRQMIEQENPVLLGRVVERMIEKGRYEGVEIGFLHRLAERLMVN